MYLENIKKTNDIKKLDINEKKILSEEIRQYILSVVSKNGGHLASNLGVVELTIALESVFDMKKDKIVWDVGHQCYTHKILNGRKEELKTIRTFGGISGFPKCNEAPSDTFNTGHSSTSISAAMGMATARDINKKNYNVIAVIGDGALTGGMALEALNHVGCSNTKMIIILNDNEMSISKNISGINKLLTRLRSKKKYRTSNENGKKIVTKIPIIGNRLINIVSKSKNAIKQLFIPGMYFEEIGVRYLGPVDGHNIEELEHLLYKAKELDGPTLIHVVTKKGKGYEPAELTPEKFHGVNSFDIKTGNPLKKSSIDYSKTFGNKLIEMAASNKKIVAITAAMKDGTGLTKFSEKYPKRFFDVGIAEQHALTFAAGLAKEGLIPFVSIYSSFYQRAIDQVIHDICLQNLPVIMCVDRAGIVGKDGETHQGLYDMSLFKAIPNLTIMCPKNFYELEQMLEMAVELKKPCVIRYPRGGENYSFDKNKINKKAEIVKKGTDLTLIGIGTSVGKCMQISEMLEKDNINAEVINVRYLKPLDYQTIKNSIEKTKKIFVIEDNTQIGGLSSTIKELIVDKELKDVKSYYFSYPDEYITHGDPSELEKKYKMDNKHIYNEIKKH